MSFMIFYNNYFTLNLSNLEKYENQSVKSLKCVDKLTLVLIDIVFFIFLFIFLTYWLFDL